MRRPLLVGQAPPRGGDGGPAFPGDSGRRLADLVGLPSIAAAFDVVNLLERWPGKQGKGDAFPIVEARAAAAALDLGTDRPFVLLAGGGVAAAFGESDRAYFEWFGLRGLRAAVVPHPSGINLWWNAAAHRERAACFMRDALAHAAPTLGFDLSITCPSCTSPMRPEHAHYRCARCGYRDSCCF